MLPVKYVCDDCGAILYEKGAPLPKGKRFKTPQEVIDDLKRTCPHCHRELVFDKTKIEVTVSDDDDYVLVKL